MQMTNEEIVRDYSQSANKAKQIKILAELNQVSPGEIRSVLAGAGVEGVKMPERIRKQKPEKAPVREAVPASLPAFCERVEAILSALPEDMSENTLACTQNLLQTLFADYLALRLGKGGRHGA